MEELKLLIEMVANLPSMALWVLTGFFAYKVIVVGSIYGVIRFVVDKAHSWATTKHKRVEVEVLLDGVVIGCAKEALLGQLRRVSAICNASIPEIRYLHSDSVQWLREAIDDKITKDQAK